MPDVQPLADYSSNPSGIGASVLPDIQGLSDILDKEDESYQNSLNELAKRKAQSAAALSDLTPNLNGILDSDAPYFQKQGSDLMNLAQKATATGKLLNDYTNPYFWQVQQAKNQMASEVQASINQKQNLAEIYKRFDPTKHDADYFDQFIANWRSQATPTLRSQLNIDGALKTQTPDILRQLDDETGKLKDKETLVGDKQLADGRYATVYNKGADQGSVESIANEIYNSPKNRLGLRQLWETATTAQKQSAQLSAEAETQQNKAQGVTSSGDPLKYLLLAQAKQRAGSPHQEYKNVAFNPAVAQAATYNLEHPSDDNTWRKRYGLTTGDPAFYDKQIPGLTATDAQTASNQLNLTDNGQILAPVASNPEYYSDFDAGTAIGNFAIDVPKTLANGLVATDNDGNTITTKILGVPNQIIAHRTFDGKPYIQTTESKYNYAKTKPGVSMDDIGNDEFLNNKAAWYPESPATPRQIINAKTDKEKDELRKQHNDFVNRNGGFTSTGDVDPYRVSGARRPSVPSTDVNEKRYILNGKAYKESVLKQQGYDVTKLPLYNQ